MIVDIPTSWRRKQEQLCLCVGHMGELYNSGYTKLFTVWGEQTLCRSNEPSVVCGYKLAPPGEYDEMISAALLMQTVATITVTLVRAYMQLCSDSSYSRICRTICT